MTQHLRAVGDDDQVEGCWTCEHWEPPDRPAPANGWCRRVRWFTETDYTCGDWQPFKRKAVGDE